MPEGKNEKEEKEKKNSKCCRSAHLVLFLYAVLCLTLFAVAGDRAITEATRRWPESRAPQQKKKDGPSKPRTKPPRQAEKASETKVTVVDRRREKRVAEVEAICEAHL